MSLWKIFIPFVCTSFGAKSFADAKKFNVKNVGRGILVAPRTFLQQKDRRVHEYVCSLNYFGYFGAI